MSDPFSIGCASGTLGGVQIITDVNMVDSIEDWSDVRSPSRAKRRQARGFRQNIKIKIVPKKCVYAINGGRALVMHPDALRALEQGLAQPRDLKPRIFLRGRSPWQWRR